MNKLLAVIIINNSINKNQLAHLVSFFPQNKIFKKDF